MAMDTKANGRRSGAQAQAEAESAITEPTPTVAPEPTRAEANAAALAEALVLAETAEQAPVAEQAPAMAGRRAHAKAQTAAAAQRAPALVLAQDCAWHVQPGLGKYGVTVETDQRGTVREYIVWVPQNGRVQKLPLYDGFFALLDSGALA